MRKKTFQKLKLYIWLSALFLPLLADVVIGYEAAKGGYDGKHCAGLLDAVWECSKFEYYVDYIFNPLVVYQLAIFYLVAVVAALIIVSLIGVLGRVARDA